MPVIIAPADYDRWLSPRDAALAIASAAAAAFLFRFTKGFT